MVALGKTLDRRDGLSVMHHRKRQAGVDATSLNQHRAGAALAVIATLLRAGQREMFTQRIQQCRAWIERQRMRAAVDLKRHRYGRLWRFGFIERAGAESCTRERGQEQRGGSGLNHRTPGNLRCDGFILVHNCSMFVVSVKAACRKTSGLRPGVVLLPAGRHQAYGQVSSGRLTTTGVAVLCTTTHRTGSSFEGLISICGRKAGTRMKSPDFARAEDSPFSPQRTSQMPEST